MAMRTTFSRNSDAYRWSPSGALERVDAGTLRQDYALETGDLRGALITEQVTDINRDDVDSWGAQGGAELSDIGPAPGASGRVIRVTAGDSASRRCGISRSYGIRGVADKHLIFSFFIRPGAGEQLQVYAQGGIGESAIIPLDSTSLASDDRVLRVAENTYWVRVRFSASSAYGAAGNGYVRFVGGDRSPGTHIFDIWGLNNYVADFARPDFLHSANSNETTTGADNLDAPAGTWLPKGRHTWRGAVRMSADPREPTILGYPDGRIYAADGRLQIDGAGTLWQPDGQHKPGDLIPFYWTTQIAGQSPDFTLGRAYGDTDWWNSHLVDIIPFPRVIPESEIREALGL